MPLKRGEPYELYNELIYIVYSEKPKRKSTPAVRLQEAAACFATKQGRELGGTAAARGWTPRKAGCE